MSDSNHPSSGSSLWTTQAALSSGPLKEASVDLSVSADQVRDAVRAGKVRAQAFSGRVTEELLRKTF